MDLNSVMLGFFVTLVGYFGNRLVNSVDKLNENVAVLISRVDSHEKKLETLEKNKED